MRLLVFIMLLLFTTSVLSIPSTTPLTPIKLPFAIDCTAFYHLLADAGKRNKPLEQYIEVNQYRGFSYMVIIYKLAKEDHILHSVIADLYGNAYKTMMKYGVNEKDFGIKVTQCGDTLASAFESGYITHNEIDKKKKELKKK